MRRRSKNKLQAGHKNGGTELLCFEDFDI